MSSKKPEQKTMDQILEEKIKSIISSNHDQITISEAEVREIVSVMKEEMEEYTAKTVKKHFRSLANHILKTMGD